MDMVHLGEQAKSQLAQVTGFKPVAVTGASQDDGTWRVRVEMLEMSRIPPATDVLGAYDVFLTEEGQMLRFARKRTRLRGEPMEEEEEE